MLYVFKLSKASPRFAVSHTATSFNVAHNMQRLTLQHVSTTFKLTHVGRQGVQGIPGADGEKGEKGDPGEQGEQGIPGEGDKNFTLNFTNQANLVVTHNLNKYPAVTVIDSAEDLVVGDIQYLSLNSIRLVFSSSFTGKVICN